MATDSDARINRMILSLAALRPTQRELSQLRDLFLSVDQNDLYALLRDLEDEIRYSPAFNVMSRSHNKTTISDQLMRDLNDIRTRELKQTIPNFAKKMYSVIEERFPQADVPPFDPRRGFREWIRMLAETLTPSEVYQVAAVLREREIGMQRPWSISRR